jgi:hypothetical protein
MLCSGQDGIMRVPKIGGVGELMGMLKDVRWELSSHELAKGIKLSEDITRHKVSSSTHKRLHHNVTGFIYSAKRDMISPVERSYVHDRQAIPSGAEKDRG